MTTLRKPDGSESTNIQDTIKTMMNHLIPEDIEESYYPRLGKWSRSESTPAMTQSSPKGKLNKRLKALIERRDQA